MGEEQSWPAARPRPTGAIFLPRFITAVVLRAGTYLPATTKAAVVSADVLGIPWHGGAESAWEANTRAFQQEGGQRSAGAWVPACVLWVSG